MFVGMQLDPRYKLGRFGKLERNPLLGNVEHAGMMDHLQLPADAQPGDPQRGTLYGVSPAASEIFALERAPARCSVCSGHRLTRYFITIASAFSRIINRGSQTSGDTVTLRARRRGVRGETGHRSGPPLARSS